MTEMLVDLNFFLSKDLKGTLPYTEVRVNSCFRTSGFSPLKELPPKDCFSILIESEYGGTARLYSSQDQSFGIVGTSSRRSLLNPGEAFSASSMFFDRVFLIKTFRKEEQFPTAVTLAIAKVYMEQIDPGSEK